MRKLLILAISFHCFILAGCSTEQKAIQSTSGQAEKCDAPVWNEGDSWKFVGGGGHVWEETVVKKDNVPRLKQTPPKQFYGNNIPIIGGKLFPLWVGKKYDGIQTLKTTDGLLLNYTYSFKVTRIVDVKVEAGIFKSYEIEFKLSAPFYQAEGVGYYYYSPTTKSIVRFKTKSHILYQWEDYELSSFSPRE